VNGVVRNYAAADDPSRLRCRVLSFLDTAYDDDVTALRRRFARVI
jgi:hypothetical protein